MKVVFRISQMGFGGAERVFLSVTKELRKNVDLDILFVVDSITQAETEKQVLDLGLRLVGLNCTRTLKSIIPFKKLIDLEKPDLIISAYTDTNFAAVLSAKLSKHKPKVIVSEHASLSDHWQSFSRLRKLLLNLYVRVGYQFADHLLAVSNGIANQLAEYGHSHKKISCIHNPVRFKAIELNGIKKTADEFHLLAVGRVTPQKDYKTLVLAFAELVKFVNCKLTIVGGVHDARENSMLMALVSELKLTDKIEFVGFTENIQEYYLNADVFVLSSAWEGFGNVIVEAMAFGLPVVSTDCKHGPAEILENGKYGLLVPIRSPETMAKALLTTIQKLPSLDINKQVIRASDFSEQKIAADYLKLFNEVRFKV